MRRPTPPNNLRYWLQQIHLWSGLVLCVPFVLLGLTGSVLVFHEEIEAWSAPPLPPATVGSIQPGSAILDAAARTVASGFVPTMISFPLGEGDYARVRFSKPMRDGSGAGRPPGRGPGTTVLVDPVSLDVSPQPAQARGGWVRIVHVLHGNLMIEGRLGRQIVGALGVVMLALGITGIVLWWPRKGQWRMAFTISKRAKGFRLHRDLHGAVGIWSLLVFMVVSFTGVYLAFPETVGAGVRMVFPGRDLHASANAIEAPPIKGATPVDLDHLIALARKAAPDRTLVTIMLAQRPGQPVRAMLRPQGERESVSMTTVYIDPWRGQVIETRDPRNYTIGETLLAWQRALHEGSGLGWGWKILVFVSGFLPLLFSVTGVSMWLIKRQRRAMLP